MTTLAYGLKRPQAGDRATGTSGWMTAIEDNFTRIDAHDHDGVDSALLSMSSITKYSSAISSASWVLVGGGTYSQLITVPASITDINTYFIKFINAANGYQLHLSWERVSAATYTVYINDNTISLTAYYV